ncbi:MAG: (E)-4-hydroxy-3-methylbut-2-enyl-diphosphate synthase [Chlamydiales bacterium]|nr:(E)-4-hydroxy-3-methylbut-2-enyl-diphosphate synthase [Chlamydiales bacterium]
MKRYCESTSQTSRWKTREVFVGKVGIGGSHPVRIQSMTTSPTDNVEATVEQIIRLADLGCEIARITVQGKKEAYACEQIKNLLLQKGCNIPLVADIHFYPPAAIIVADFVDKVRINPGNYLDKRATFKLIEYTDEAYAEELIRIEENFLPLLEKCKQRKIAMRMGTNHGSLSDRIMNRFGDTPNGMVESALEYARVCRKYDFHDLIFSMKASNPLVMIHAYRLLVARQMQLGWNYPLHLGVTEAGEGEDGRVKSAVGIGSLLLDGLGDTIRVSLTEDPWYEIDPCKRLGDLAKKYNGYDHFSFEETSREFDHVTRRDVVVSKRIPLHENGAVGLKNADASQPWKEIDFLVSSNPLLQADYRVLIEGKQVVSLKELDSIRKEQNKKAAFQLDAANDPLVVVVTDEVEDELLKLKDTKIDMVLLHPSANSKLHYARYVFDFLMKNDIKVPVILNFSYTCTWDDVIIHASAEMGSLLCDGLGDGVLIEANASSQQLVSLSFAILQACRRRSVKTDFISCPSCGRTLFNLQQVSENIRKQTSHLPGVKIAIMGCIVNGPGEMADADFGYVGSKPGKIDLYVGKTCVERGIDSSIAVEKLIDLIKYHGKWIEPSYAQELVIVKD